MEYFLKDFAFLQEFAGVFENEAEKKNYDKGFFNSPKRGKKEGLS